MLCQVLFIWPFLLSDYGTLVESFVTYTLFLSPTHCNCLITHLGHLKATCLSRRRHHTVFVDLSLQYVNNSNSVHVTVGPDLLTHSCPPEMTLKAFLSQMPCYSSEGYSGSSPHHHCRVVFQAGPLPCSAHWTSQLLRLSFPASTTGIGRGPVRFFRAFVQPRVKSWPMSIP